MAASCKSTAMDSSSSKTFGEEETTTWQKLKRVVDYWLISGMHPGYFVSVMGTGIASNILYNFPWHGHWLRVCSYIMFAFAAIFFVVLFVFFVIALIKCPEKRESFHCDPKVAPFMGQMAMGYMCLVNFIWYTSKDSPHASVGLFVLWWVSVVLSIYTSVIIFYFCYYSKHAGYHKLKHTDVTLNILLPIVTITVASSQGNIFLLQLPTVNMQVLTFVTTFILWAIAVGVAFMITTLNMGRIFEYKAPATDAVFSSFLPVGFLGQGGFGVALMAHNLHTLIMRSTQDESAQYLAFMADSEDFDTVRQIVASIFMIVLSLADTFLIGVGYFMTALAVLQCVSKSWPFANNPNPKHVVEKWGVVKFSKAYWGMTFPLGTMSLAQSQLASNFGPGLNFFKVMSAIYAVFLFVITIGCIIGVLFHTFRTAYYVFRRGPLPQSMA
ncbi:sulfite efflux pump Ssu1p [Diutina catenulata]